MDKRGYVPLHQVGEYSEKIVVGELGLPVGFDAERLNLHVGRTERAMHWAGIGQLSLAGYHGETTQYGYSADNIFGGVGTAVGAKVATKAKTYEADSDAHKAESFHYRWRHTGIKFNNAEIVQRITTDDKWDKGVFDPTARAHYMDKALKAGIRADIADNELNIPAAAGELGWYMLLNTVSWGDYGQEMVHNTPGWAMSRIGVLAVYHRLLIPYTRRADNHLKGGPEKASMLFYAFKLDRAMAAAATMTRRLIIAK